ncbi:MAG: HAD-IA family hydrolase [Micromonosporaceae bacterium]|nr:HAD-IA family hydrolase [Micromonosporaceae bacterium]
MRPTPLIPIRTVIGPPPPVSDRRADDSTPGSRTVHAQFRAPRVSRERSNRLFTYRELSLTLTRLGRWRRTPRTPLLTAAQPGGSLFRAVLFDFFGTLTEAVARGPWHAAIARRLGCDPAAFTEVLDRSFKARSRGVFGTAEATLRWVCDQLGVDPPADRLRAAQRARLAAVWADAQLRPDAVSALAGVRARGLRTGLVSDCGYELPAFLPELPVAPLLDTCVYSVHIGECKPHPAMYAAACDRLGVAPEHCLYVGDGGSQELTGAVAAGMSAVRLAAADLGGHLVFAPDREFAGPVVRSLTEVVALLDRPALAVDGPARDLDGLALAVDGLAPDLAGLAPDLAGLAPDLAGLAPAGLGGVRANRGLAGVTSPP